MSRSRLLAFSALLLLLGAAWGLTQPLSKIAVSTGHRHFGLIFWQMVIGGLVMALIAWVSGRRLPLRPGNIRTYLVIAVISTIIPNSASYQALVHLPAGVQAVLMSLVPMVAFPIAILLVLERFEARRLFGLALGLGGVLLLVLPRASLPDPAMLPWVAVTMIAVLCYAFEGNYVVKWGLGGLDPIQVLWGASSVGAVLALPLAVGTGQFIDPLRPFAAPDWAVLASAVIHVLVYAGYVWLVARAGVVFSAQVGYPVTAFGVVWAMILLSETYSPYFWAAAVLILLGVFVVRPRQEDALDAGPSLGKNMP